jgi:WD40 repeat protein
MKGHDNSVKALEYIKSNVMASGSTDGTIQIWAIRSGVTIKTLKPSNQR